MSALLNEQRYSIVSNMKTSGDYFLVPLISDERGCWSVPSQRDCILGLRAICLHNPSIHGCVDLICPYIRRPGSSCSRGIVLLR